MKLRLTIDYDFDVLKKDLPKLMAERMNRDMDFVKKEIDDGIKKSVSPVTGKKFKPISEVTKEVRRLRRTNRKSKDKPLVATGRMSRLKKVKVKQQGGTKFSGYIEMGAPYGAMHLLPRTIATNFSVKSDERRTRTISTKRKGTLKRKQGDVKNPKGTFFKVKGKRVPARVWFGVPKRFTEKTNFDRFVKQMNRKLKQGKKIIRKDIGSISLG